MTYAWDNFSASLNLTTGPQHVIISGRRFTCYAMSANRQFYATCDADLSVYSVDLDGHMATPVSLSAVRPIAMSAWHVSAQDMCMRAARVADLNEAVARLAISTHFATGLVTEALAEELIALILAHNPNEDELTTKLAKYNGDMPGSPRRLAACTEAVLLLAPHMKP